jgi:hypothetical protein
LQFYFLLPLATAVNVDVNKFVTDVNFSVASREQLDFGSGGA